MTQESTKTISLLRGGRDNAGTRILHLYYMGQTLRAADRYELFCKTETRMLEIIDWLDRHDIQADEGDYSQ